ncbi:hypothetical protein BC827DRAFT_1148674, partial [Russula dissimulans]
LYTAIEGYLVDITWVSSMSWRNDTNVEQTYTYTFTTELEITQGSEVNNGFSLGATYKGLSLSFNNQTKRFQSTETTESRIITIALTVPPRSHLIFYQRRYTLRDSMTFIAKHLVLGDEWNVGTWAGDDLTRKDVDVQIMSEDYATLVEALDGSTTGTISVATVAPITRASETRPRKYISLMGDTLLAQMGI